MKSERQFQFFWKHQKCNPLISKHRCSLFWKDEKINTAGYHRHVFRPPILLKMPFKKMKAFFFQKIALIKFCNFSKFWNLLIFCKKTQFRGKRLVLEIISFDTVTFDRHSTANLPPLRILKKKTVFSKNPTFFQKQNNFSTYLRNLTTSVTFYGQLAIIWRLKKSISEMPDMGHFQLANKRKITFALSSWFSFHIIKL